MKNLLLLIVFSCQILWAQEIKVLSVKQLKTPNGQEYFHPRFDPNNENLLVSKENYAGLQLYSIKDNTVQTITTDKGAGWGVQISSDGNKITYIKSSYKNNMRQNSVYEYSRDTKKTKQILSPIREPITLKASKTSSDYVKGKKMVENKKLRSQGIPNYIIQIENQKMVLYNGNQRQILLPNGEQASYFWASISPNQQYIVYTVASKGTFTCNINGSNPISLGKLSAPKWINNQWIVGMNDIDDGEKLISSTIAAKTRDGKHEQTLAMPNGINAMYPSASADGTKIAFNTDKGELYIMDIQLK